jgi:hypothetical protein
MADPNTIKVKPWSDDHGDFVLINEDEFNPDFHELLDEDSTAGLHIGKGPRGRLYVKNGKDRVAGPFDTQEEADAALQVKLAGA